MHIRMKERQGRDLSNVLPTTRYPKVFRQWPGQAQSYECNCIEYILHFYSIALRFPADRIHEGMLPRLGSEE